MVTIKISFKLGEPMYDLTYLNRNFSYFNFIILKTLFPFDCNFTKDESFISEAKISSYSLPSESIHCIEAPNESAIFYSQVASSSTSNLVIEASWHCNLMIFILRKAAWDKDAMIIVLRKIEIEK